MFFGQFQGLQGWHCSGTKENPDVCGHKYQTCIYMGIWVDIENFPISKILMYKDDTIENPDVCGHKQQTSLYVDIKAPIQCWDHCQTIKDPDVCGHKHQTFFYVDIKLFILLRHHY